MRRWAIVLLLAGACKQPASAPPPPGGDDEVGYPGTLRPPSDAGPDFQWQQHVVAHWEGRSNPFDAVLSKTGDELLLIGLGPMKSPGFIVRLHDGKIDFENRTQRKVPIEPSYIMLDVQRVYFPWIPGAPPQQGERTHRRDGEIIVERWSDGRLIERSFRREDDRPPGQIVVRYTGWADGADAPRRAELDNGWFGYRLEIETLVQQRL